MLKVEKARDERSINSRACQNEDINERIDQPGCSFDRENFQSRRRMTISGRTGRAHPNNTNNDGSTTIAGLGGAEAFLRATLRFLAILVAWWCVFGVFEG